MKRFNSFNTSVFQSGSKFKDEGFSLLVIRILYMVVQFICYPILLHNISITTFGCLAILFAISGFFTLFDFGISNGLVSRLSSTINSSHVNKRRTELWNTVVISFALNCFISALLLFLNSLHFYDVFINVKNPFRNQFYIYINILILGQLISSGTLLVPKYYLSISKNRMSILSSNLANTVALLAMLLVSFYSRSISLLLAADVILPNLIMFIWMLRILKNNGKPRTFTKITFGDVASILATGRMFFLTQIFANLAFEIDFITMGRFFSVSEIGLIAIFLKIGSVMNSLTYLVYLPLWVKLRRLHFDQTQNIILPMILSKIFLLLRTIPFTLVLVFFIDLFLHKYRLYFDKTTLCLITLVLYCWIYVFSINAITNMYFVSMHNEKFILITSFFSTVLNLSVTVLLYSGAHLIYGGILGNISGVLFCTLIPGLLSIRRSKHFGGDPNS